MVSDAVMFFVSLSEAGVCIVPQPEKDTETWLDWEQRNARMRPRM